MFSRYTIGMTYRSTVVINKEGRWFVARSIELGVVSQGRTVEDAQENLKEAVELYLDDMPKTKKYLNKGQPLVTSLEVSRG